MDVSIPIEAVHYSLESVNGACSNRGHAFIEDIYIYMVIPHEVEQY